MALIEVDGLLAGYGEVAVLKEVSLRLEGSETVAGIGANGAGKSTLVAALCGLIPVRKGRIVYRGTDVTELAAHQRARRGIGVVLEGRHLFGPMTARQHLTLGSLGARATGDAKQQFSVGDVPALFPFLRERMDDPVELMSGGGQQMGGLARALLLQPQLMILDEPPPGLSPLVGKQIMATIDALRARGMGILLVEQNVALAAQISDRAYVLSVGRIVHEVHAGEWPRFLADEKLVNTYLGG